MNPYGTGDTLHILQQWIIEVKPRGPAVKLKVMIVFLFPLYIYVYGLTYLLLNLDWLKSLKNKQKIVTLI